jgi:4-amino-4-deoxy-L-arabinose transferase-like glycosyltransferase
MKKPKENTRPILINTISQKVKRFFYFIEALPLVVIVGLGVAGSVAITLLLIGVYKTWLYLFLTLILSVPLMALTYAQERAIGPKKGSPIERGMCFSALIILVLSWVVFNFRYNSQHVMVNRDPAVYTNTAGWLMKNDSLDISRYPELNSIRNIRDASAGFGINPNDKSVLYSQGAHVLPALAAMVGRIFGEGSMFSLNIVFGGVALVALYAFTRSVLKPRWALFATMTLSVSLPLIYFSRDMYTEPLALIFTFGGMAALYSAYKSQTYVGWLIAGLLVGAGALTRIDAYLTIALILLPVMMYLVLAGKKEKPTRLRQVIVFLLSLSVVATAGYLDVRLLSSGYYRDTAKDTKKLLLLVFFVIAFSIILTLMPKIIFRLNELYKKVNIKKLAMVLCVIFLIVSLLMLLRPLLYHGTSLIKSTGVNGEAVTIVTRNRREETLNWLMWYAGAPATLLGLIGLSLLIKKFVLSESEEQKFLLGLFLSVAVGTSALYLVKPTISPDQIWASRRFLPIIMPSFIVACMYFLEAMFKSTKMIKKSILSKIDLRILSAVLSTLVIIAPLFVSFPFLKLAPYTQYAGVGRICASLPSDATILWVGIARLEAPMPTRVFCGLPSVGMIVHSGESIYDKNSIDSLKQFAKAVRGHGRLPYIGLFSDSDTPPTEDTPNTHRKNAFTSIGATRFDNAEIVVGTFPRSIISTYRDIKIGRVTTQGFVDPL